MKILHTAGWHIGQAFGPYVSEQVFDFRKLEESNLFLITGDTGAGKATMFDAMGIALFGESSGGERSSKDVLPTEPA